MKKFYDNLLKEIEHGYSLALAIILNTMGSTPQVPAAKALFSKNGLLSGTLGGGILEADAQKKSLLALQENNSLLYTFNLNADIDTGEGAICGGNATVLIDSNPRESKKVFESVKRSLEQDRAGVLVTTVGEYDNGDIVLSRQWIEEGDEVASGSGKIAEKFKQEIKRSLKIRKPQFMSAEKSAFYKDAKQTQLFFEPLYPDPKLIIAGAGHIGQALSHMAKLLDFHVVVVDDRPEYAHEGALPDADEIINEDFGKVFKEISITSETYLVLVTAGHKKDMVVLKNCINSSAAYIGVIGSLRKIQLMREKFLNEKWASPDQLDRIFAPIGLDIKSKTVQEIAVSICAQLILIRQKKSVKVCSVILAAGESKRMGEPKLLMAYNGSTIIETVVENSIHSKADKTIVVVGAYKEQVFEKLKKLPIQICVNENFQDGMISSVQKGITEMPKMAQAALIMLADQPMIKEKVIDQLIRAYRSSDKGIVIAISGKKRGHPLLVDMKYKTEILNLDKSVGLHEIIYNHPDDILEVDMDDPDILKDIDTPKDYETHTNIAR